METYFVVKPNIPKWVDVLAKQYRVYVPVEINGKYIFNEFEPDTAVCLEYPTTVLPPKKILLPVNEILIDFHIPKKKVEPCFDLRPTVIFGIHTCDMYAFELLDAAMSENYSDQHYKVRRENLTMVSIECLQSCSEHSFCRDMGRHTVPEKFDIHLIDIGDGYIAKIGSSKGAALLKELKGVKKAGKENTQHYHQIIRDKWEKFPYRLDADVSTLSNLFNIAYKSTYWDDIGDKCLGCGSCNIVCPTCYCFDVRDDIDLFLQRGHRYRIWDSCQMDQFAIVAGGHNFREQRGERQRHRFLHKFNHQKESGGLAACVGCGRCSQVCLVNITPVDVINKLHKQTIPNRKKREGVLP